MERIKIKGLCWLPIWSGQEQKEVEIELPEITQGQIDNLQEGQEFLIKVKYYEGIEDDGSGIRKRDALYIFPKETPTDELEKLKYEIIPNNINEKILREQSITYCFNELVNKFNQLIDFLKKRGNANERTANHNFKMF